MKYLLIAMMAFSSLQALAGNKIIYGQDHRKDLFETSNTLHAKLAKSTAIQMSAHSISTNLDGTLSIDGATLEQSGICSSEKFSQQPAPGRCSGFLVAEDLLVTAGHCITNQRECENNVWVFDFAVTGNRTVNTTSVSADSVYKCKEIISQELNDDTMSDYALVRLDRKVTNRAPLKYRKEGKVKKGAELVVIGYPSGLPLKVADGAKVKMNNKKNYFVSNLDTYGGNSGSAVFDATTGIVEGILVRGGNDYRYSSSLGCQISNHCSNSLLLARVFGDLAPKGCIGEDVTRITTVKKLP